MSLMAQITKLKKDIDKICQERFGLTYGEYLERMEAREQREEQTKGNKMKK